MSEKTENLLEYRRKRSIPIPELMTGWCVVEMIEVDTRTEGGLFLPTGGESAMETLPDEQRQPPMKFIVRATAKQYPVNATTLADTPFEVGDSILPTFPSKVRSERIAIVLPEKHMAVWIADVAAWQPCPMDQSKRGDA